MVAQAASQSPLASVADALRAKMLAALEKRTVVHQQQSDAQVESIANGGPVPLQVRLGLFADLENLRRELEELLESCKAEVGNLAPGLLEDMAAANMEKTTVNGLTIFSRTDRFVNKSSALTQPQMCAVLEQCGLGFLVTEGYNAQKLKSHILEIIDTKGVDQIPEELAAAVSIGSVVRLVTNKA